MLVRILIAIAVVVAVLVVLGLVLRLMEGRLLYHPTPLAGGELGEMIGSGSRAEKFSEVEFEADDGVRLTGWLGTPEKPLAWLLWLHGNAGNVSNRIDDFRTFVTECGFAVLLLDYRGYGRSGGKPEEEGLYRDARAARKFLLDSGADPERLFYLGRSLGGAVATALAVEAPPAGLILESTFTSIPDMGRKMFPLVPVEWIAKSRFATIERIGRVDAPVLLIHGERDEIVPFEQGERLAAAGDRLRFLPVPGAGHNDVSASMGEDYFSIVREFVADPEAYVEDR